MRPWGRGIIEVRPWDNRSNCSSLKLYCTIPLQMNFNLNLWVCVWPTREGPETNEQSAPSSVCLHGTGGCASCRDGKCGPVCPVCPVCVPAPPGVFLPGWQMNVNVNVSQHSLEAAGASSAKGCFRHHVQQQTVTHAVPRRGEYSSTHVSPPLPFTARQGVLGSVSLHSREIPRRDHMYD